MRIALDVSSLDMRGVNRYGFAPLPDPELLAFGSSTASGISSAGFAAAERMRSRLLRAMEKEGADEVYAREIERARRELTSLCGLSNMSGLDVVMAVSGTDVHLIAAHLFAADPMDATQHTDHVLAVMVGAAETGSGVPLALAARHRNGHSASAEMAEVASMEVVSVPVRHADGRPRSGADVDAEFSARVRAGCAGGHQVLLVLCDVSKSGLIAPSPACAIALKDEFPHQVEVLVDACQFRMGVQTLRAYLEQGFMVALTGSKFLGGPPFSGALLLPHVIAARLRARPVPRALLNHSVAADWPHGWKTYELGATANFGFLIRWEAALHELRAFRAVAEEDVANFLRTFAHSVRQRLADDATLVEVPVTALERKGLSGVACWDTHQTIFPFLLLHGDGLPLSRDETMQVYRSLQKDLGKYAGAEVQPQCPRLRCQLGQPVAVGERDGISVSALRLCVSARLIVEAGQAGGEDRVIAQAMRVLDKTVWLARTARHAAALGIT